MPQSKRNKIVHLTQVKKKGKDHKGNLMKQLEQYVEKFSCVYLFGFEDTRSDRIMNLRLRLKEHGTIFAGRNTLITLTLRTIGSSKQVDYEHLLKHIKGHIGLFFTDLKPGKLLEILENDVPEFKDKLKGYTYLKGSKDDETKFVKL